MKLEFFVILGIAAAPLFSQEGEKGRPANVIVPPPVEQKFVLEFPQTEAQWQTEGNNFKAKFINPVNNLGYIVVYGPSGGIVRREKELEPDEVPAKISEYLSRNTKGQGFVVWTVTDSAGTASFYSQLPEGTVLFDRSGIPVSDLDLLKDTVQNPVSR